MAARTRPRPLGGEQYEFDGVLIHAKRMNGMRRRSCLLPQRGASAGGNTKHENQEDYGGSPPPGRYSPEQR